MWNSPASPVIGLVRKPNGDDGVSSSSGAKRVPAAGCLTFCAEIDSVEAGVSPAAAAAAAPSNVAGSRVSTAVMR
ncbi:hypothetical protein [Arthrobacter agilis]|uniref:hypothetical protein n=1 Tax=Arthrobacter agilis TaxID=37921 RepID=UPI001EFC5C28|nr:hypothetical protein [Arthrobacter agilis]